MSPIESFWHGIGVECEVLGPKSFVLGLKTPEDPPEPPLEPTKDPRGSPLSGLSPVIACHPWWAHAVPGRLDINRMLLRIAGCVLSAACCLLIVC